MPKISLIIPVYNVENYLPQCLSSVSRQSFRDFELILVDDGSNDGSGVLCDAFASAHPNTRVIHQKNMGLSEARNQGVKVSNGEYIAFADSDDYMNEDYLAYLLYLSEKYETDVSVARKVIFWDDDEQINPEDPSREEKLSPSDALEKICYNRVDIYAWGKLYKRELVLRHPYPIGRLYEDMATTYKIVVDANAVACGSRVVYFWRQRSGSITHAEITEKHLYGITAAKEQLAYMMERYPTAVPAARARCVMKIIDLSYRLTLGKKNIELFRRVRAEVKPHVIPLLKDSKAGISLKVRALALSCGYIPYALLSKLYTIAKGHSNRHRRVG